MHARKHMHTHTCTYANADMHTPTGRMQALADPHGGYPITINSAFKQCNWRKKSFLDIAIKNVNLKMSRSQLDEVLGVLL